jgi:hypothetical protein
VADTKTSALSAAAAALGSHEIPVNESGASKKVTLTQVLALVGDALGNSSGSNSQAPTAATLTYITGSSIAVPVGKLRIGTTFLWRLDMTKTAAGTAARNFFLKIGTAGTTADATILTFPSIAGTAVIDSAYADIVVTIKGPLSASCIARGVMRMDHKLATTGFFTVTQTQIADVTSSAFDATVANLIVGLAVTTGASEVITFQQVLAEAKQL